MLYVSNDTWKKIKRLYVFDTDAWKLIKGLWVSDNNVWKRITMERKITNYTFPTLKSDTTKDHASGIWNNETSARTGNYGGYNYQGFMMGRPSNDSDGMSISGGDFNVTSVKITLVRSAASGYPPNSDTTMSVHSCPIWSGAPGNTPPTIPYNLSAYYARFKPPALGETKTFTITDSNGLKMFSEWLNTNRYLCFWDPGDTAAYSSYTRVTIDELIFY